jgi:hypothetical protein
MGRYQTTATVSPIENVVCALTEFAISQKRNDNKTLKEKVERRRSAVLGAGVNVALRIVK